MQRNAFEQAQLRASALDDESLRRPLRLVQIALFAVMGASTATLLMYNLALWMARNP